MGLFSTNNSGKTVFINTTYPIKKYGVECKDSSLMAFNHVLAGESPVHVTNALSSNGLRHEIFALEIGVRFSAG